MPSDDVGEMHHDDDLGLQRRKKMKYLIRPENE